jgi:hypothetical protein
MFVQHSSGHHRQLTALCATMDECTVSHELARSQRPLKVQLTATEDCSVSVRPFEVIMLRYH